MNIENVEIPSLSRRFYTPPENLLAIAEYLVEAKLYEHWRQFGANRYLDYVTNQLNLRPRWASDLVRIYSETVQHPRQVELFEHPFDTLLGLLRSGRAQEICRDGVKLPVQNEFYYPAVSRFDSDGPHPYNVIMSHRRILDDRKKKRMIRAPEIEAAPRVNIGAKS